MIVCHCAAISDRAVVAAIDEGAATLAQLCRASGTGQDCGRCVFTIKQLLCTHGAISVSPTAEVIDAAGQPTCGGAAELSLDARAHGDQHVLPARTDAGQLELSAAG
ncbi:MAG: bacterioferritin-associated ferredoxin [Actinomycetes bacterium]